MVIGIQVAESVLLFSKDKVMNDQLELLTTFLLVLGSEGAARHPDVFLRPLRGQLPQLVTALDRLELEAGDEGSVLALPEPMPTWR